MLALLQNQRWRDNALQAGFVGLVLLLVVGFVASAHRNLEAQGITSGFDFLFRSTGWDIGFSLLPYGPGDPYWRALLIGILNTLFLGVIGLGLATVVGILVGSARTAGNRLLNLLGAIYVETFRNIPLILQVFFWYAVATRLPGPRQALTLGDSVYLSSRGIYLPALDVANWAMFAAIGATLAAVVLALWVGSARRFSGMPRAGRRRLLAAVLGGGALLVAALLAVGHAPGTGLVSLPTLQGLNIRGGIRVSPELAALAFAIAIYGGAYVGEIVRGGFNSVGRGQVEAAQALGLTGWQVFSRVRFPLALRAMLPALTNQYVWLIKATTMGIAVGFTDFFMVVSVSINQSGQTVELIAILMAGFLLINFSLAAVLNRFNRAIALRGSQLRT